MALPISKANSGPLYRIGAVANITRLSTHSIRAWERRYNLKIGRRSSGGTRSYNDKDVVLLSLLKALTDRGDAISEVAHLPEHELRKRLEKYNHEQPPKFFSLPKDFERLAKAVVLGDDLADYLRCGSSVGAAWRVCWKFNSVDALWEGLKEARPDVLLTRLQTLGREPVLFLDEWNKQSANILVIVFYEFKTSAIFESMTERGAKLVKWPIDAANLSQLIPDYCLLHHLKHHQKSEVNSNSIKDEIIAQRIFSDSQLMELKEVSTNVECECPSHLASILFELNAFEEYTRNCLGDDDSVALHAKLARQAAMARASLEEVLLEVCNHENIKI